MIGRWNYITREYDPYEIPDNWNVKLYSLDMDEIINCTSCGKEVTYGECYTSFELHNDVGLGYPVCQECYDEEIKRKIKYKDY